MRGLRLNRTIPNLGIPEHRQRWQRLEAAKHRPVYGLLRLQLPLVSRWQDPDEGLAFDFLAGGGSAEPLVITTGHAFGIITIDIVEADNAEWERHRQDFAETWAHYLHIVDAMETTHAFGLCVRPRAGRDPALSVDIDFDPCQQQDFDALIRAWLPLTFPVNSLNHSVGLAPQVMGKLRFVHGLIHPVALSAGPPR